MNTLLIIILSLLFLILIEQFRRQKNIPPQILRSIAHIGATIIAATSALFVSKNIIILSCLAFAIAMFFSQQKKILSAIHSVSRKTYGEIYLPIGEAITAFIFLPHALQSFVFGILVLGFSDPAAAFIGQKYGRHKFSFLQSQKSVEGSLAFFIVTVLITFFFLPTVGFHLLLIPLSLTVLEALLGLGMDNLIIPVFGAYLFTLFS